MWVSTQHPGARLVNLDDGLAHVALQLRARPGEPSTRLDRIHTALEQACSPHMAIFGWHGSAGIVVHFAGIAPSRDQSNWTVRKLSAFRYARGPARSMVLGRSDARGFI